MATAKFTKLVSPAGVAQYAYLDKPSDKYTPVFKVDLLVPKDECADFCKKLDALTEEAFKAAQKENPKVKASLVKHQPYSPEVDEDGEPTGRVRFKFKASVEIKNKDGAITPKVLRAFDAKAKPIQMPAVYSGSRLRVECAPLDFYNASSKSAGISLRIVSVQILSLVSFDTSGHARGYEEEENGYEGDPVALAAALAATTGPIADRALAQGLPEGDPSEAGAGFRNTLRELVSFISAAEGGTPAEVILGQLAGVATFEEIPYQATAIDGTKRSPLISAVARAKKRLAAVPAVEQDIPF